jgi:preprotein translocase subunit SecG
MTILPLATLVGALLGWLMGFLSIFLIMLILIQRGKGGGLTGALGGPGGQSAFGSKAGDTFTLITIVVASLWGLTCVVTMLVLGTDSYSPALADETNMQAGPGDEEEPRSGLEVSPGGDLSGLLPGESETSSETPATDLIPASPLTDESAADPAAGEAESGSTETSDAAAEEASESSGEESAGSGEATSEN